MRPPIMDEYDDYVRELRYEPEISTRDVADLLRVSPATVRQWVARGHLCPVGKSGASNLYRTDQVLAAFDAIKARGQAGALAEPGHGCGGRRRPVDRVRPKHYDAVVSVDEAARLMAVSPSTVRSWMHRGQLKPLASSTPRTIRLRLGDVVRTAQARQQQLGSARSRRGQPF